MTSRTATAALLLSLCAIGCGSAADDGALVDAGRDLPLVVAGEPCVTDSDCPSASLVCAYPLADGCAAKGHCAAVPTPTCASFTVLCGCDGSQVRGGGCFYADGYAGGPTTGGHAPNCSDDGGI